MTETIDVVDNKLKKIKQPNEPQGKYSNQVIKFSFNSVCPCINCEYFSYYGCIKSDSCVSLEKWIEERNLGYHT